MIKRDDRYVASVVTTISEAFPDEARTVQVAENMALSCIPHGFEVGPGQMLWLVSNSVQISSGKTSFKRSGSDL